MISMYRKKLILNYHIKDGYGAKRIIKVMRQRGEEPASLGVSVTPHHTNKGMPITAHAARTGDTLQAI